MSSSHLAVGVDLGGSHVAAAVVDAGANIVTHCDKAIDRRRQSEEIIENDIIDVIEKSISALGERKQSVQGISIGIPGRTDHQNGICVYAPNLKWHHVNVRAPIESRLGLPVFIINDARAMAMGEKIFGNGRGVSDFVCLALGTGLGGGIVMNGKLHLGCDEGAGEVGHITVKPRGPKCGCGNYGCAEAFVSGPNIVKRAKKQLKNPSVVSLLREEEIITPKVIYEAAAKGDKLSLKIWEDTGEYLGIAMATIATVINPRRFLFSGKISRAIDFFLPSARKELEKRAKMIPTEKLEIMRAKFEDNAGLIGNAAHVFESMNLSV